MYNDVMLVSYIADSCNNSTDWGYRGTGKNFTCQLDLKKKVCESLHLHYRVWVLFSHSTSYQLANTRYLTVKSSGALCFCLVWFGLFFTVDFQSAAEEFSLNMRATSLLSLNKLSCSHNCRLYLVKVL